MATSDMTYGQYLALEPLLTAQHPVSDHHDELLFIIIHQTKELWLKQILHELRLAVELVRADKLIEVHKNLSRVSRIQSVMTLSWDVLATLTPTDYLTFRGVLGSSSGFQSAQFREVEYRLGLKDGAHLSRHEEGSAAHAELAGALGRPSLWDEANAALARGGFALPAETLERDWTRPYQPSPDVEAAWAEVYRDTDRWWRFYQLAEKLVDIDDALATWRHKHAVTVERVIGFKRGTGGTAGVKYLQSTLLKRAFPELWTLRTQL
ncbi:tryptophan 2,3-dioxygenase family protein [Sphingosinicella sp. LHD-64]|uniref:tryptophan 2,3-dioxygenase n=1 Tax=Sphingosinicella sp. LHD-64 TaxID=3072139 RepID=UPI00280FF7D0|nr:tryptophan 2,3-dioxygenase family protein [Sphingosinicella sp. LHD-64]MDQ8758008.1 tryptophan 2,3-dioxygenase family protein [Sphingosinicella sp. LHD-64]